MNKYTERTIKTLTVILSKDNSTVTATIYDPNTGDDSCVIVRYSPDEHQEFNERVGNELYWYVDEYIKTHGGDL